MNRAVELLRQTDPRFADVPEWEVGLFIYRQDPRFIQDAEFAADLPKWKQLERATQSSKQYAQVLETSPWQAIKNAASRGLKQAKFTGATDNPELAAELQRDIADLPSSPEYFAANQPEASSLDMLATVASYPHAFAEMAAETTTAYGGTLIRKIGAPVVGAATSVPVGAAAAATAGAPVAPALLPAAGAGFKIGGSLMIPLASYALESSAKLAEIMGEEGYNPQNTKDWERFLANPEALKRAKTKARLRGAAVAAWDYLGWWLGGRLPGRGRILKGLEEWALQAGTDVAGELSGQVAAGEELSGKAVLQEVLAGSAVSAGTAAAATAVHGRTTPQASVEAAATDSHAAQPVLAPETAGADRVAPATFLGRQETGIESIPDFDLFNLEEDVPGVGVKGSTVAGPTLEKAGYKLPAQQPLGEPTKAGILRRFKEKVAPYFRTQSKQPLPIMEIDGEALMPKLQDYERVAIPLANDARGLGRVPGLAWFFDPRSRAISDVDQAKNTAVMETWIGHSLGNLFREDYRARLTRAFQVDSESIVHGVRPVDPTDSLYLGDVMESLLRDEQKYQITEEQQAALKDIQSWLDAIYDFQKEHGVLPSLRDEDGRIVKTEEGKPVPIAKGGYFPRPAIGKEVEPGKVVKPQGRAQALGAVQPYAKKRFYASEREGREGGVRYIPSIEERIADLIERSYKSAADQRLINNPHLGGLTPAQRVPVLKAEFAQKLKSGEMTEADIHRLASHPFLGQEGKVFQPGLMAKIFPREVADSINKFYGEQLPKSLRILGKLNDFLKGATLGADIGFASLQLVGVLGQKNGFRIYARSMAKAVEALFSPEAMSRAFRDPARRRAAREMAQMGGSFGVLQDAFRAAQRGSWISDLSLIRQAGLLPRAVRGAAHMYQAFARSMQAALDLAKIDMYLAWRDVVDPSERPRVVEAIEGALLRGKMEDAGLHPLQALAERLVIQSPAYYRGGLGVIATAFERGVPGSVARRALTSWLGAGATMMAAGYALSIALGKTEHSEIEWERLWRPDRSDFMTVPLPFGPDGRTINVGIGGPFRAFLRLGGAILGAAVSDPYRFMEGGDRNPIIRWMRGKVSPTVRFGWDAISGRDFAGDKVTWDRALLRAVLPLAAQEALLRSQGEAPSTMTEVALSVIGLNSWPESLRRQYTRARDTTARQRYSKPWSELGWGERLAVTQQVDADPKLRKTGATSERLTVLAFQAAERRRERLLKQLPKDAQKVLQDSGLMLPSYSPATTLDGTAIPWTAEEIDTFETALAGAYNQYLVPILLSQEFADSSLETRREWLQEAAGELGEMARAKAGIPTP